MSSRSFIPQGFVLFVELPIHLFQFRNISGGDLPSEAGGCDEGFSGESDDSAIFKAADDFIFLFKDFPSFPYFLPEKAAAGHRFSQNIRHVLLHGVIDEHRLSSFPGKEDAFRHFIDGFFYGKAGEAFMVLAVGLGNEDSLPYIAYEEHEHQV